MKYAITISTRYLQDSVCLIMDKWSYPLEQLNLLLKWALLKGRLFTFSQMVDSSLNIERVKNKNMLDSLSSIQTHIQECLKNLKEWKEWRD